MKKILYILPILVLFLPLRVHAVANPTPTVESLTLVENTAEVLTQAKFVTSGLMPFSFDEVKNFLNQYIQAPNQNLFTISSNDCVVRPLTSNELSDLDGFTRHFYDSEGNEINMEDSFLVTYDNGFFSGQFYINSVGQMLYASNDNSNELINIRLAGDSFSSTDWDNLYDDLSQLADTNNYNIPLTENDIVSDVAVYIHTGYFDHGQIWYSQSVYCPNAYQSGVCVAYPENSGSASIQGIYTNDLSLVQINTIMYQPQWYGGNFSISEGDFQQGIYHYRYRVSFGSGFANVDKGGIIFRNYNDWISGRISAYDSGPFAFTNGAFSSSSKYSTKTNLGVKKIQFDDIEEIPDLSDYLLKSELENYIQSVQEVNPEPNPEYDPSESIDPENYPQIIEVPIYVPSVTPVSFPNQVPGSDPNPNPNPNPNPGPDPLPDPELGEVVIDPSAVGNSVPLISNLGNRFPFSIPFDIYNLVSGLAVPREAPHFEFNIHLPTIDYDWHIVIDLSIWNSVAEIFRVCFLILFIIGLALFAYKHLFGS